MTARASSTVLLNGNAVFYRTVGSAERPPLVLLHGLYGDSTSMVPIAERFADHFFVIAPDALGHGRSARPEGFTLADQGRMVGALVTALGYDSAALLGLSMGSYLAAQAAVLAPERFSRLILVVGKAHGMTSSVSAYATRMGFDLASATPDELIEFMAGAMWSADTSAQRRAEIMAEAATRTDAVILDRDEQAAVERSLAGFDLRPELHRVSAPTLVISGRADGLNPPAAGRELAEGILGARFEVYEHSGHMLMAEETDRLVADVTGFVGAL